MRVLVRLLVVLAFGIPMASAQTDALKRADALIREGHPQPALELLAPLAKDTEFHANGGVQAKLNSTVDTFDYLAGNLAAGVRHDFGLNQVSLAGTFDTVSMDNNRVRDTSGLTAEYRRIVHPLAEVSVFGQFAK